MKVIVMAAGVGSRLASLGIGRPKCLLDVGGETLLSRLIRQCRARGVTDISVVGGYQFERVAEEVGDTARCYHNPHYRQTNSLVSLWHAREQLEGDVILMNGDLYFEPAILDSALAAEHPVMMLADSSRVATADYRFALRDGNLLRHGKTLPLEETDAEYVGISYVGHRFMPQFRERVEQLYREGRTNDWWEEGLYSFVPEGVPITVQDVAGMRWTELDCPRDWDRLQAWISPPPRNAVPATFALPELRAA